MEYFRFLPIEIALDIFSRLPTEAILDCKLVSTTWRSIVGHPTLSKLHLDRLSDSDSTSGKLSFLALTSPSEIANENFEYFEFDENNELTPIERIRRVNMKFWDTLFRCTKIVGSCNGLVCLFQSSVVLHCICNPVTREYVMLPYIEADYCQTGFGYISSTNEYKVVGLYILKKKREIGIQIYTLGSGLGWRNLGNFNSKIQTYPCSICGQPVFANGALYWMGIRLEMIITFDLAEEKFSEEHLAPPPLPLGGHWHYNRLGVLDGMLYFAICLLDEGTVCYDIWLLKKKNDNHEQGEQHQSFFWSKEFRVYDCALLAKCGDGVLCLWDKYLNFYDTKASTSKWLVDLKKNVVQVLCHKNTLVSLKELGEKDVKKMETVLVEEISEENGAI